MSKIQTRIQIPTLLIALGLAGAVHAATFNVTDGAGLQNALTTAQNNGEADTINLAAGNYDASGGTFTYVADNGLGKENFPLTLQGAGADVTILDGRDVQEILIIQTDDALQAPFHIDDNADVTIQGMTFQNGRNDTFGSSALDVVTNNANVILKNCLFFSNNAHNAVHLLVGQAGGDGNILVDGNSFIHNISDSSPGAAFLKSGGGSITITNNIFFNNHALNGSGGAFLLENFSNGNLVQFINNTVIGNSAVGEGGGISLVLNARPKRVDIYNNIIFNNTAGLSGNDVSIFIGGGAPTNPPINLFNNDLSEICFSPSGSCDPTTIAGLSQGGEINVDPQLIDPANGDFHLAPGSHAIDAGDLNASALPATDHDGSPRVIGPAPDMGALEVPLPATSGGSGGGSGGNGGGNGDPASSSGCALQGGTPAAWNGLLASLLFLPLAILRGRRRA